MNRLVFAVLGIVTALNGFNIMKRGSWCSSYYNYCTDFMGYHVPFGIFLIIVGLFIILASAFGKRYAGEDILMCAQCNKPYERKNTQNHMCPKCHVELEPLDGFYDRHPELKDK